MFKVRVYDWSKGELEVIDSYWHLSHQAIAHADTYKNTVKVYNSQGELLYTNSQETTTYA